MTEIEKKQAQVESLDIEIFNQKQDRRGLNNERYKSVLAIREGLDETKPHDQRIEVFDRFILETFYNINRLKSQRQSLIAELRELYRAEV